MSTLLLEEEETGCRSVAELVLAAQDDDREAFGELVERFERAVFATAWRRLRNYAEAQELTQEVFVQALRKIGHLRQPECFGGWLRTITVAIGDQSGSPAIGCHCDRAGDTGGYLHRARDSAVGGSQARAGGAGPRWPGSAASAGSGHAGGVLREGQVAGGNQRRV